MLNRYVSGGENKLKKDFYENFGDKTLFPVRAVFGRKYRVLASNGHPIAFEKGHFSGFAKVVSIAFGILFTPVAVAMLVFGGLVNAFSVTYSRKQRACKRLASAGALNSLVNERRASRVNQTETAVFPAPTASIGTTVYSGGRGTSASLRMSKPQKAPKPVKMPKPLRRPKMPKSMAPSRLADNQRGTRTLHASSQIYRNGQLVHEEQESKITSNGKTVHHTKTVDGVKVL